MRAKTKPLTPATALRFRQIHLDFHTHGSIRNIGSKFTRHNFQAALKTGHVDSVTVFSKCHHGWSYHPTKVGRTHPGLAFDLLGEQMAAARAIGVRTPVYISSGFDEAYADQHGDLLVPLRRPEPATTPGFVRLCFNTPYLAHLVRQTEEVMSRYHADGFFFDIVSTTPCYCRHCLASLVQSGRDPDRAEDVLALAEEVFENYVETINSAVRKRDAKIPVFHNTGHVPRGNRFFFGSCTHFELESLPTGGWGYDHFPLSAKYAATKDTLFLGMTGKFHTTWGEFGGFKHDNALRYECNSMLAYGARCSVGDQLHPLGEMNADSYRKIGLAYAEVENKEQFCVGTTPVSEVAVLSTEALNETARSLNNHLAERDTKGDIGASRMLLQRQVMFDVIDADADFNAYRCLIIPDHGLLNDAVALRLRNFSKQGGRLLLSGNSGLSYAKDKFLLPLGKFHGRTGTDMDFLKATPALRKLDLDHRLVKSPFAINGNSFQVTPPARAKILAQLWHSYFNRTAAHYCSHQHAPEEKASRYPGAFMTPSIGYVASEIFSHYADSGQALYRDLVYLMLAELMGHDFNVTVDLPSAGRISLAHQPAKKRYLLHLLYATPLPRGDHALPRWNIHKIDVIEDILPLFDIACSVRLPHPIRRARAVSTKSTLPLTLKSGRLHFSVPRLEGHEIIELSYR